jgi:hypothetical protein
VDCQSESEDAVERFRRKSVDGYPDVNMSVQRGRREVVRRLRDELLISLAGGHGDSLLDGEVRVNIVDEQSHSR